MTDDFTLRGVTGNEYDGFGRTFYAAFNNDYEPAHGAVQRLVAEPDRMLGVFGPGGGDPVATALTYTRGLAVPGGVVPAGHVSAVAVLPTYRRRGLLTRIMHRQLWDIRDGGEPVAVLWPTEDPIYGRFGYAPAAWALHIECDIRQVQLTAEPGKGELRAVPLANARNVVSPIFERVRSYRPGHSSRPGRWWEYKLADTPHLRGDASALRCLVYDGGSGPDGYALWRVRRESDHAGHRHQVVVEELVAADLPAYLALWQFLLRVDLARTLRYRMAAVDEALLHLVDDPRQLGRRLLGNLWLRLTDVPAALTARRYAAPVDTVLDVSDPILPENTGRWRLRADTTGATCERTDAAPDLTLTVTDLGAAYLGGTTLTHLAHAGRIQEHAPDALATTSTAFGWHRAPVSIEVF